jgi:hypothetical protein
VPAGGGLPWSRPRYELVLLALVAVAVLSPIGQVGAEDQSRVCLSEPGEVDFRIDVTNRSAFEATGIALTVKLAPGMQLLGAPGFTRDSGCTGSATLTCNLDFLDPKEAQRRPSGSAFGPLSWANRR